MNITYRPYIRDLIGIDIPIKSPFININGYKPKYSSSEDHEEDIVSTPVESQIKEIRELKVPGPNTSKGRVRFKSKKEFKDTLMPIYEEVLSNKGINPIFAEALVAQDGLESAWGSKPSGKFNFGGIKGMGTTKRTREVINGKDTYIYDNFRDFASLKDYINYKVNLLNSKRYKAFSGTLSEFADRVQRGGYATDPKYSKVLNSIITSMKRGGVLKFQEGGSLEKGKEWLKDWYKNRKEKLKINAKQNPKNLFWNSDYGRLISNMDETDYEINPRWLPDDWSGGYFPRLKRIYLRWDDPSSAVHEWVHASIPKSQVQAIARIKDKHGQYFYDNSYILPDEEYWDDPNEIYARLMQLRHSLGVDASHKFTAEEVEDLKRNQLQSEILRETWTNGNDSKVSHSIFDKDGKIIRSDPYNAGYKIDPNKTSINRDYDLYKSFEILNRYSTNAIVEMLNDVAYVPKTDSNPIYAKLGFKVPTYKNTWGTMPTSSHVPNWRPPMVPKDFSGIHTTNNRTYNSDYLNYINNFLVEKGYNVKQRAALLGDIIEESGGNPLAKSNTGKYEGILQWGPDRYRIKSDDPYTELESQLENLHTTLSNTEDGISWTHGGKGSHFNTGKQAQAAFTNSSIPVDSVHRGLSFGYVRPKGKESSYKNRQKVVDQVYNILNKSE